jgi:hypothetical protein
MRGCTGRKKSSCETHRSESRERERTSGTARRRPGHGAKNYRHAAEERPFQARRGSARDSRHQPEKAGCAAPVRHGFRTASDRAFRAENNCASRQEGESPIATGSTGFTLWGLVLASTKCHRLKPAPLNRLMRAFFRRGSFQRDLFGDCQAVAFQGDYFFRVVCQDSKVF